MSKWTRSELTEFAHLYLQGSNQTPLGVLDNPFFKSEVSRLWGPKPTAVELERERNRARNQIAQLIRHRAKLLGPRGGRPKSGQALWQYNNIQYHIDCLSRSL